MKRKILTGAIVLAILCTVGIMTFTYFELKFGIKYDESWNQNVSIVTYKDGKYGVRNDSTGNIMGHFDDIMPYYSPDEIETTSLVIVKDNLRGYLSAKTGEMIFEPQFLYAWIDNAENNLAACVNCEKKMGFVNLITKEIAIPFQYDFDEEIFLPNGEPLFDFVFHNGICITPGKNGKLGLIDETGKQLLPAIYSDIIDWKDGSQVIILEKDEGEAYVYNAYDRILKVEYPFEYNVLYKCNSDNENPTYIASKNDKYGILDSSLKEILTFKFDNIEYTEYNDAYILKENDKYGVVSKSCDIIIPIEYDRIKEIYIGDDKCHFGYVADINYTEKLFDYEGVLLSDFYVDTCEEYDLKLDSYVTKPGLEVLPDPLNGGDSQYIKYFFNGSWGIIDSRTKKVIVPAKYNQVEYLGQGNFACILGDKTNLIKDN